MLSNKVREIMNREVTTTPVSTTILDAMAKMVAESVGRVVITENQMPVGIFTADDILRRVMHRKFDIKKASIRRVMTSPIRAVPEEAHVIDVLGKMYRGKFCHMVVHDNTGEMAGLVSVRRIFKFAVELGQGLNETRTVGSIMSGRPVTVSTASSISDAIKGMIAKGTCAAMVLANGEPKGIFTSRDVMNRVAIKNINTRKTPIEEVMTDGPIIVSRSALLSEVFLRMYEGDFRHMPIRGEKGDLVGMVTMAGVIKYAKVLDVDGTVRRAWKEIKEFWESEAQYTPG